MTDSELFEKMKDKKYYKKVTNEKGLVDFLISGFKQYSASTPISVHEPIQLAYYKPENESNSEGYGDYGIYAVPLNKTGQKELDGVVTSLKEKGLLEDNSNIRYESMGGFLLVDLTPDEVNDSNEARIRRHSTDNLLVYVFTNTDKGGINKFDRVVYCKSVNGYRRLQPISLSKAQ